jgi:hypothetical protein
LVVAGLLAKSVALGVGGQGLARNLASNFVGPCQRT